MQDSAVLIFNFSVYAGSAYVKEQVGSRAFGLVACRQSIFSVFLQLNLYLRFLLAALVVFPSAERHVSEACR
jgi:hypothetical protein